MLETRIQDKQQPQVEVTRRIQEAMRVQLHHEAEVLHRNSLLQEALQTTHDKIAALHQAEQVALRQEVVAEVSQNKHL